MARHDVLDGVPSALWRMVALARHRILMLDYDGTLAPFEVDRLAARPRPEALVWLRRLVDSRHTDLAIVSGRPMAELEALVGDLHVTLVAEHGWERRASDGVVMRRVPSPDVAERLETAERRARASGWGDWLERKHAAVVLHTRALLPERAREVEDLCRAAWEPLASGGRLVLDRIDGGLELRARARHKGTAVLSLLSQASPGTLGVYVGDDVTDEDAFEVVRDWGFGVRVGADDRSSIAQGRMPRAADLATFLEEWCRVTGGSS